MEYMTQIGWFHAHYPLFEAYLKERSYDKADALKQEAEKKGFYRAAIAMEAELRDARVYNPIGV